MVERGKIRNREFASTLRDFAGLRWGSITPTDIDGFLDFGNKAFVFIESKHENGTLRGGQKLALERLVDSVSVPAILIVAKHNAGAGDDIDLGANFVTQYRLKGKWQKPKEQISVRSAIEAFLAFVQLK